MPFFTLCRQGFFQKYRYDGVRHMVVNNYHHTAHKILDWKGDDTYSTRETLVRALFLASDEQTRKDSEIAAMVEAVLATQDRNPANATYGLFPYYANYGFDQMSLNDYNWAVFNGNSLIELLEIPGALPATLRERVEESILLAAECVRRRDVAPTYTNIAIHSLPVLVHAGKQDPLYLENARQKLAAFRQQLGQDGGLREYLSSTYYGIDLEGLLNLLMIAEDPEILDGARWVLDLVLRDIADHYDHSTAQLAGPHARSYATDMAATPTNLAAFLHFVLKEGHPAFRNPDPAGFSMAPFYLLKTFATSPNPWIPQWFFDRMNGTPEPERFVVRGSDTSGTVIHTRFNHRYCVGWVNAQDAWEQRNNLIAYWPTPAGTGWFQEKLLRDSEIFSEPYPWVSGNFTCRETSYACFEVAYGFARNRGDRHFVDKDEPNRFSKVLIRFSLEGLAGAPLVEVTPQALMGIAGFVPKTQLVQKAFGWDYEVTLYDGPFRECPWDELVNLSNRFLIRISATKGNS